MLMSQFVLLLVEDLRAALCYRGNGWVQNYYNPHDVGAAFKILADNKTSSQSSELKRWKFMY